MGLGGCSSLIYRQNGHGHWTMAGNTAGRRCKGLATRSLIQYDHSVRVQCRQRICENDHQFRSTEYSTWFSKKPIHTYTGLYCTPCPPIQCVFVSDWLTHKHTLNRRTGSAVYVWTGFLLNQVLSCVATILRN